jgi:hypothetical protein
MLIWPEFETREIEGRLLVGRAPRVRRSNRINLGAVLFFGVPLVLGLIWYGGGAPRWAMASLGVLSAAGGLLCFRQVLKGGFELHEDRDIAFDRAGDRVTKAGKVICALSSVTGVDVKNYPSSGDYAKQSELILFFGTPAAGPPSSESVVLLSGLSSQLAEPAARIRSFVGGSPGTAQR